MPEAGFDAGMGRKLAQVNVDVPGTNVSVPVPAPAVDVGVGDGVDVDVPGTTVSVGRKLLACALLSCCSSRTLVLNT